MYNHVSQVVYFHNPQYCKRVFKAPEPEDLLQGRAHPLYPFAGLLQLYPDIPVVFSDGALNIFSQGRHSQQWLLMDQQIFLVTREGRIYRHGARSSPLDLCPLISRENT